jgi:hypothetical protein
MVTVVFVSSITLNGKVICGVGETLGVVVTVGDKVGVGVTAGDGVKVNVGVDAVEGEVVKVGVVLGVAVGLRFGDEAGSCDAVGDCIGLGEKFTVGAAVEVGEVEVLGVGEGEAYCWEVAYPPTPKIITAIRIVTISFVFLMFLKSPVGWIIQPVDI